MKSVLIVFFIFSFCLAIIFFPFKTRIMGHINLIEMKCFYSIKIWLVKLLCGKIILDNGKIKMTNEKTILSDSYNSDFVKNITTEILEKIDVKKMELFFTGGFKDNSFSSAIMCGSVVSMVETLYGYLSLKFDNVKMYKDIKPTFDEDNLELTFDAVFSISLFELLVSVLKTIKKIKLIQGEKNEG